MCHVRVVCMYVCASVLVFVFVCRVFACVFVCLCLSVGRYVCVYLCLCVSMYSRMNLCF